MMRCVSRCFSVAIHAAQPAEQSNRAAIESSRAASQCVLVGWQVLKVLEGHTDAVLAVAISTDGAKIVSGSGDKTVRVWSAKTGEVPACLLVLRFNLDRAGLTKSVLNDLSRVH